RTACPRSSGSSSRGGTPPSGPGSYFGLSQGVVAVFLGVRLEPRRGGNAELGDQVEMGADQRGHGARDQEHVYRVEARQGGRVEVRATEQEVRQERPDERATGVDVD